eukprot:jgi/Botrbrau1/10396/Bobra.0133s0005.1
MREAALRVRPGRALRLSRMPPSFRDKSSANVALICNCNHSLRHEGLREDGDLSSTARVVTSTSKVFKGGSQWWLSRYMG